MTDTTEAKAKTPPSNTGSLQNLPDSTMAASEVEDALPYQYRLLTYPDNIITLKLDGPDFHQHPGFPVYESALKNFSTYFKKSLEESSETLRRNFVVRIPQDFDVDLITLGAFVTIVSRLFFFEGQNSTLTSGRLCHKFLPSLAKVHRFACDSDSIMVASQVRSDFFMLIREVTFEWDSETNKSASFECLHGAFMEWSRTDKGCAAKVIEKFCKTRPSVFINEKAPSMHQSFLVAMTKYHVEVLEQNSKEIDELKHKVHSRFSNPFNQSPTSSVSSKPLGAQQSAGSLVDSSNSSRTKTWRFGQYSDHQPKRQDDQQIPGIFGNASK